MTHPVFVTVTLVLTVATGLIVHCLDDSETEWGLGLTLLLALMIYPSVMKHYDVMLIVPIALLLAYRENISFLNWTIVVMCISFGYYLIYTRTGNLIFFATFYFWLIFYIIGVRSIRIIKSSAVAN